MNRIVEMVEVARRRLSSRGPAYVVQKAWENAVVRPLRQRRDFRRYGSLYPVPLIFIAGQAKGGSTWFGNMFASLPGFKVLSPMRWKAARAERWDDFESTNLSQGLLDEFRGKLAVVKHHTWGFPENARLLGEWGMKYLITVRDPRDMLISHYYYSLKHPENWDHVHAVGRTLEEYIGEKLASGDWNRQAVDWPRSWILNRDPERSLILRYEDALENPAGEMRRALDFLGFKVGDELLQKLVLENSFEKVAGRKRGDENTSSFQRKGVAGEWRDRFIPDQQRMAREQAGDVLEALGYES